MLISLVLGLPAALTVAFGIEGRFYPVGLNSWESWEVFAGPQAELFPQLKNGRP